MKTRLLLTAPLLAGVVLLTSCNDTNDPRVSPAPPVTPPVTPAPPSTVSAFVASLLAMVTGNACNTATPASLDGLMLMDDMDAQDANALPVNCG